MKLNIAAAGVIGAMSVSSATSAAIGGRLKRDNLWANQKLPNPSFDPSKAESYSTTLQTKQLASKNNDQPLLSITKSVCVDAFFSGLEISKPATVIALHEKLVNVLPESGFNFAGSIFPVGCRVAKMSKLKQGAGFGYLSETAVQNDKYGLALFHAVSNTKDANRVDFEDWLFFFKKENGKWTTHKSGRWSRSLSTGGKQQQFSTKPPLAAKMEWNPPSNSTVLSGIISGTTTRSNDLWESNDSTNGGIWLVQSETGGPNWLLENGSTEREAVRCKTHIDCDNVADPLPFLKELKLTHKGRWQSFRSLCETRSRLDYRNILDGERNLCFNKQPSAQ